MKTYHFLLLLLLVAVNISAANLHVQDFSGTFPPSGWARSGANNGDNWVQGASSFAGGTAPEARFAYNPETTGDQYFTSPGFNTSSYRDITLSFRYNVSHFDGIGQYTVGLMIYGSDETWTTIWSVSPSAHIAPTEMSFDIDNSLVDTQNFQFRFFFSGDSYYINYFSVDDVLLDADVSMVYGLWTAGQTVNVTENLLIPAGESLTIEQGVTVYYHGQYNIEAQGEIFANGTSNDPITFAPATVGSEVGHIFITSNSGVTSTFSNCYFLNLETPDGLGDGNQGAAVSVQSMMGVDFTDCVFYNNTAGDRGGALYFMNSIGTVSNCRFENNSAMYGGSIATNNSTVSIDHCLFAGGIGSYGGALSFESAGEITMDHCTISYNDSPTISADILVMPSSTIDLSITNSVFWDNETYYVYCTGAGIMDLTVKYCDIQGGGTIHGATGAETLENNFNKDPLFDIDYGPSWSSYPDHDSFRSPLIDGGDPEFSPDADNTVTDVGWKAYEQEMHVMGEEYGVWDIAGSPYKIGGPVTVPEGQSLIIEPGVDVQFNGEWDLTVLGDIQAEGTRESPVTFGPTFSGIKTGHVVVDGNDSGNCIFDWCSFTEMNLQNQDFVYGNGAAIMLNESHSVTISNSNFSNNMSGHQGGAIGLFRASASITDCRFADNFAVNYGGVFCASRSYLHLDHCLLERNSSDSGAIIFLGLDDELFIDNCTITDNDATYYDSEIYAYPEVGTILHISINNTVFWDSCTKLIRSAGNGATSANVFYCVLPDGGSYSGNNITVNEESIIDADPLWDSSYAPTWASYPDEDETKSPLIDNGNPLTENDLDGTRADIGYTYFDQSAPAMAHVKDIPGDQGHQVQLLWKGSSFDSTYDFSAYYSVWRMDEVVRSNGYVVFDNPETLIAASEESRDLLYLRYDDYYWAYIASVPAIMNDYYIFNAPTLADSSASGTNEATFMVMHHRAEGLWSSDTMSGYSVDNIAPDAVRMVTISRDGSDVNLEWSAVTNGTFEGNSYSELNGVWYKVYAGQSPDFPCDETTYLYTTQDSSLQVDPGANSKLFYKIVVSDQP